MLVTIREHHVLVVSDQTPERSVLRGEHVEVQRIISGINQTADKTILVDLHLRLGTLSPGELSRHVVRQRHRPRLLRITIERRGRSSTRRLAGDAVDVHDALCGSKKTQREIKANAARAGIVIDDSNGNDIASLVKIVRSHQTTHGISTERNAFRGGHGGTRQLASETGTVQFLSVHVDQQTRTEVHLHLVRAVSFNRFNLHRLAQKSHTA